MGQAGEKTAASSYNPAWMAGESRGLKRAAALLAVAAAAALLAACGSSDSGTSAPTSTAAEGRSGATGSNDQGQGRRPLRRAGEGGSSGGANGSASSGASTPSSPGETAGGGSEEGGTGHDGAGRAHSLPRVSTPLRVAGGGSAQFRTPHGDNSVQDFGQEAGESELREAAEALHEFYVARENEEWPRACSLLSSAAARQLEELASQASGGAKGCADVLGQTSAPVPADVRRELTVVDAASLRREGDSGFLIYRGEYEGQSKVYAINMTLEAGGWKVAGLGPLPLE